MMNTSNILALAPLTVHDRNAAALRPLGLDTQPARVIRQVLRQAYNPLPVLSDLSAYAVCGALASLAVASVAASVAIAVPVTYAFMPRRPAAGRLTNVERCIVGGNRYQARVAVVAIGLSLALGTLGNLVISPTPTATRNLLLNEHLDPFVDVLKKSWDTTLSPQAVARNYITPALARN